VKLPSRTQGGAEPRRDSTLAQLDAALFGEAQGAEADMWRALSADVRRLAPPIEPSFEEDLRRRLAERGSQRRRRPKPARRAIFFGAPLLAAALAAVLLAVVLPGVSEETGGGGTSSGTSIAVEGSGSLSGGAAASGARRTPVPSAPGASEAASSGANQRAGGPFEAEEEAQEAPSGGAARLQELGASITLRPDVGQVQSTSDRVGRLAINEGGFVQRSQIESRRGGRSEAELLLDVPSGRLAEALAALARVAPVQAESQSLQDVSATYESTRRRLHEARAESAALLRALQGAESEEQIEHLRQRLAHERAAVARIEASLRSISRRVEYAQLEVRVEGRPHHHHAGLTIGSGLHDALTVLTVALVVLLIAAAVIVPLVLVLGTAFAAQRAWRRRRRESALDVS
jgi:Domain of unknown function (DUF4349)